MRPFTNVNIAEINDLVALAAFETPDDSFKHIIAATADGKILELFFGSVISQAFLENIENPVSLAGFYTPDDHNRHVIVGTRNGDIHEIFFNPKTGSGDSVISKFGGSVPFVAGFYSPDDHFRHVLAAAENGDIHEIFFHPDKGIFDNIIGNFGPVSGLAGFYSEDDEFRHAIVATQDGDVREIFFHPKKGSGDSIIGHFDNIVGITAYYTPDNLHRNVVIITSNGDVNQIQFNVKSGMQESSIRENFAASMGVSGFFTPGRDVSDFQKIIDFFHATITSDIPAFVRIVLADRKNTGVIVLLSQDRSPVPPPPPPPTEPPQPQPEKVDEFAFFLDRQQIFDGPIPYAGLFGQFVTGHLLAIKNPNPFPVILLRRGHTTNELFNNKDAGISLNPNQITTSDQVESIYGTETPALPIAIIAVVGTGTILFDRVQINVTYSHST